MQRCEYAETKRRKEFGIIGKLNLNTNKIAKGPIQEFRDENNNEKW